MPQYDISKTFAPSIAGIPFLVDSANVRGGQKKVTHEFPMSNRREVEAMGGLEDVFSIQAILSGPDMVDRRNLIKAVFQKGEEVTLVHHIEGPVNVAPVDYSINDSETSHNQTSLTLTFEKATASPVPTVAGISLSDTAKAADSAKAAIAASVGVNFITNSVAGFKQAEVQMLAFSGGFQKVSRLFTQQTGALSAVNAAVTAFEDELTQLILNPVQLGTSVTGLLSTINATGLTAEERLLTFRNFFGFGDDEEYLEGTTVDLQERQKNTSTLEATVQADSLSEAYRNISQIEFTNTDDLDAANQDLEDQFNKLTNGIDPDGGSEYEFTEDMLESLEDLRTIVRQFLEQQRLTIFRVETKEVNPVPVQVLAFELYGSSELTDELTNLNGFFNTEQVSGDVRVFTE
jgi:prophage DNA circulation protein